MYANGYTFLKRSYGDSFQLPFTCDQTGNTNDAVCKAESAGHPCCPPERDQLADGRRRERVVGQLEHGAHPLLHVEHGHQHEYWLRRGSRRHHGRWHEVIAVSAGAPMPSSTNSAPTAQVWAIAPSGSIYALIGYVLADGTVRAYGWFPVRRIGRADWLHARDQPHVALWIGLAHPLGSNGSQPDLRVYPGETDCYTGWWTQLPGAAKQLASGDIVLGTDNAVYTWQAGSGAFVKTAQPPLRANDVIRPSEASLGSSAPSWPPTRITTCGRRRAARSGADLPRSQSSASKRTRLTSTSLRTPATTPSHSECDSASRSRTSRTVSVESCSRAAASQRFAVERPTR